MEHKKSCTEQTERWQKKKVEFETSYPAYCRRCGGLGHGGGSYDRDTGSYDIESCPACQELGLCPLCKVILTEEGVCRKCGWGTPGVHMEFLPDAPECYCYEDLWEEKMSEMSKFDWLEENLSEDEDKEN